MRNEEGKAAATFLRRVARIQPQQLRKFRGKKRPNTTLSDHCIHMQAKGASSVGRNGAYRQKLLEGLKP